MRMRMVVEAAAAERAVVVIREYDGGKDREGVEYVERRCEVGPSGKLSLFTDLLGDPIVRVRHSPAFLMLVAEMDEEIVGMIRGCIKTVARGNRLLPPRNHLSKPIGPIPVYTKAAYILGLRVSPTHRRIGIGLRLVERMEKWFRENGAEYSYIATENDNLASVKLFTDKCGYSKFRTPSILVNPVYAHRIPISKRISVVAISPADAENLYRRRFSTTEFFPEDIDAVLNNRLSLGTFLALPRGCLWPGTAEEFLADPPESWAVVSVWSCKFTLQVKGASIVKRAFARTTRVVDRALPFLNLPSVPELFRPFGLHFLYGLGGEGPRAAEMVKALCEHAHNLARKDGRGVVAAEVASQEPLRFGIPHWKMLSCAEDLWCIKRLAGEEDDPSDWTKSTPGLSIFVDPREF